MSPLPDLNSLNEVTFPFIDRSNWPNSNPPLNPEVFQLKKLLGEVEAEETLRVDLIAPPELVHRDLPDGPNLRLKAYECAWSKCLNRFHYILHELHAPVAAAVVQGVQDAYRLPQPLLPYTELPVIAISVGDRSAAYTAFDDIFHQLDSGSADEEDDDSAMSEDASTERARIAFVVSLSPVDCPTIIFTMRALIAGFVVNAPDETESQSKRKTSTTLAAYDMKLLEVWYHAVKMTLGDDLPRLVVLLEDFEQFDPAVVQDLFYICSLHIPQLPLVFILSLSSPPQPSYIHATYPRSTLSLLQIQSFTMQSGREALNTLLLKTFFDVRFEPDIILGPTTLDIVVEQFMRYNSSFDSVITILQLVHMRHFMEPLTAFVIDNHLGTTATAEAVVKLQESSSLPFLDALLTRLHHPERVNSDKDERTKTKGRLKWRVNDVESVLSGMQSARSTNKSQARRSRLAFTLFRLVQGFLLKHGYKSVDSGHTLFEMMSACLRGTLGRKEGKYMTMMVKKLPVSELAALLMQMHAFFHDQPSLIRNEEEKARLKIVTSMSQLPRNLEEAANSSRIASEVGDWLIDYFIDCMPSFTAANLWDLWYTGQTSMLSELINPSPHASIMAGLLHPESFLQYESNDSEAEPESHPPTLDVPDVSILFRRYMESGKMINVYDWFESFAVALEGERRDLLHSGLQDVPGVRNGEGRATQGNAKRKGKGKAVAQVTGQGSARTIGDRGRDSERWQRAVQARFIRSLHELDYLGFIKQTGRKADHVVKTVWDLPD